MTDNPLTRFLELRDIKRDFLVVLDQEGAQYGLEIKRGLDPHYSTAITTKRLYSNLDELAEAGLITKETLTDTNTYEITERGQRAVSSYQRWVIGDDEPAVTHPLQRLLPHVTLPDEDND